jgi:hypothetical protein
MTLVFLLKNNPILQYKTINIVLIGTSGKVEERIFIKTNYFEELTNYYPKHYFKFFLVGPENST